jgi:hypothetical protein
MINQRCLDRRWGQETGAHHAGNQTRLLEFGAPLQEQGIRLTRATTTLSWASESLHAFLAANAFASSIVSLATYVWESILLSSVKRGG